MGTRKLGNFLFLFLFLFPFSFVFFFIAAPYEDNARAMIVSLAVCFILLHLYMYYA